MLYTYPYIEHIQFRCCAIWLSKGFCLRTMRFVNVKPRADGIHTLLLMNISLAGRSGSLYLYWNTVAVTRPDRYTGVGIKTTQNLNYFHSHSNLDMYIYEDM